MLAARHDGDGGFVAEVDGVHGAGLLLMPAGRQCIRAFPDQRLRRAT
jgi:hypothetical protein